MDFGLCNRNDLEYSQCAGFNSLAEPGIRDHLYNRIVMAMIVLVRRMNFGSCARDAHLRAGFKCDFEFRGQVQFRQFVSQVLFWDAKVDHCSQMHIARYATTRLIIKSSHQILSMSLPGFVCVPVMRYQSNLERLPLRYGSLSDVAYSAYRH